MYQCKTNVKVKVEVICLVSGLNIVKALLNIELNWVFYSNLQPNLFNSLGDTFTLNGWMNE